MSLACVVAFFWLRVLISDRSDYLQIPPTVGHREYIEGRQHTRFHLVLQSDMRGVVFGVFIRQLRPQKAPGSPWSAETQQ